MSIIEESPANMVEAMRRRFSLLAEFREVSLSSSPESPRKRLSQKGFPQNLAVLGEKSAVMKPRRPA
jgi:hypothetical protein